MNDVTKALKRGRSDDSSQITGVRFVQKQTQITRQFQHRIKLKYKLESNQVREQ